MSTDPRSEDLTDEQVETLEKAALLVISARKEAAAMLQRSGLDGEAFGSECRSCACEEWEGDGQSRRCARSSCGHSASQHET
ncbi:DUF6422 family protein [Streptomyces sp. NPDC054887]